MRNDRCGQLVLSSQDLENAVMQAREPWTWPHVVVEKDVDLEQLATIVQDPSSVLQWTFPEDSDVSVPDWDHARQQQWFMPQEFRDFDIAQHVLDLCSTPQELQRAGQELLMFQERGLFDLLKYLHYLVHVMRENRLIWGVGRGSSVASFVLYLLGVHRINSLYYDLDPSEFLR